MINKSNRVIDQKKDRYDSKIAEAWMDNGADTEENLTEIEIALYGRIIILLLLLVQQP